MLHTAIELTLFKMDRMEHLHQNCLEIRKSSAGHYGGLKYQPGIY